ncbi:hypothetical protein C4552_03170 [Candidatus Parcubacteria bacterium]|nr:MAG: hypothetical protein C4552_03170 [Candidatus Parcubacteria bacterium]
MFKRIPTPPASVSINNNGKILVRGAEVTSVASSTVTAASKWGSAQIVWTLQHDGGTEFVRYNGGRGGIGDIQVGHIISFSGNVVQNTASPFTVDPDVIRSWSLQRVRINQLGRVISIDAGAKRFVVEADQRDRGNVTVAVSDSTTFMKAGSATTTFSTLKVNDLVTVSGVWDQSSNTLNAEQVKIYVEERRTFENGRLQSLSSSTTPPTTMVVRFGNREYTVKVETDTKIYTRSWLELTNLSNFQSGHHIRVYGVADGTTIDAGVIRNMDLR